MDYFGAGNDYNHAKAYEISFCNAMRNQYQLYDTGLSAALKEKLQKASACHPFPCSRLTLPYMHVHETERGSYRETLGLHNRIHCPTWRTGKILRGDAN